MRDAASSNILAVWKRAVPRNRMREILTSGSVGGLVEQSPILPGRCQNAFGVLIEAPSASEPHSRFTRGGWRLTHFEGQFLRKCSQLKIDGTLAPMLVLRSSSILRSLHRRATNSFSGYFASSSITMAFRWPIQSPFYECLCAKRTAFSGSIRASTVSKRREMERTVSSDISWNRPFP